MAASVQDLLDRARVPLNDDDKTRFPDAVLLVYLNEAIATVRKARPDLFMAALLIEPVAVLGAGPVPVPYTHHQTLADYVTARAQLQDGDESGSKAAELFNLAVAGIR